VKELTEDEDFSLSMTPMITIVFLVLIFLLLITTTMKVESSPQIRLVSGDQDAPLGATDGAVLNIGVRKDGSVTLSGQEIEVDTLEKRLKEIGKAAVKPRVFVRGDREAPYGKVAQVYQLCVRCNLSDVIVPCVSESAPAP
jgi:biopolymer transport protein ExbD